MDYDNANDGIRRFAQGGITASIAINSGALIATLTQLDKLAGVVNVDAAQFALKAWALGVTLGAFSWLFATLSASAFANHRLQVGQVVAARANGCRLSQRCRAAHAWRFRKQPG